MKLVISHLFLLAAWLSTSLIRSENSFTAAILVFACLIVSDVLRLSGGYKGIFFSRIVGQVGRPSPTGVVALIRQVGVIIVGVSIVVAIGRENLSDIVERFFSGSGALIGFALLHLYSVLLDMASIRNQKDAEQGVDPNRSTAPLLKSESSVRGSDD